MSLNRQAIEKARPVAERVCATLGWPVSQAPVLIAQFILEKGWQYWSEYPKLAEASDYNFGNAGDPMGQPLPLIASETAGIVLYGFVLCISNPSAYRAYFDAMLKGTNLEAVNALASSPWCSPPYGKTLVEVFDLVKEGLSSTGSPGHVPSSGQPSSESSSVGSQPNSSSSSATNTSPMKYRYVVKAGDTLSSIAVAHGVPMRVLIHKNPKITDPNKIEVGEVIQL